jgi:hypothetical protein
MMIVSVSAACSKRKIVASFFTAFDQFDTNQLIYYAIT